jgi:hypothetical protein
MTDHGHMLFVKDAPMVASTGERHQSVIENFGKKPPSELELLATALYVQREIGSIKPDDIIHSVTKIKGSKYSVSRIKEAVQTLVDHRYFSIQ